MSKFQVLIYILGEKRVKIKHEGGRYSFIDKTIEKDFELQEDIPALPT